MSPPEASTARRSARLVLARSGVRLAVVLCSLAATALDAHAQAIEPRAYSNTPVGLNFLLVGYGYAQGDVGLDPSLPIKDANFRAQTALLAYVRSLDVWGKSGKIAFVLPYAWLSARGTVEGEGRRREVSGFGDQGVQFSVNLYGAPALSLEEFANYQQDTIIGTSLLVTAPFGLYDSNRLVNTGTNRWSFKPELGISQALGRWTLELAAGATLYTENDDFFGGKTREQDPLYSLQGHAIYHFWRGAWGGVSATYYAGGRTTVDGVKKNDLQQNWRFGLTLAIPIDRHQSLKLYGSTGVYARTGADFDAIGIAWQYQWGGGL